MITKGELKNNYKLKKKLRKTEYQKVCFNLLYL